MRLDIIRLFTDYHVPFATEGKHTQPGWVQIQCPYCDDHGTKLGWNIRNEYFNCWKCGWHYTDETLSILTGIPEHEVWIKVKQYTARPETQEEDEELIVRPEVVRVPGESLQKIHIEYLTERGYDAEKLVREWNLTGTGPVGKYKFRVIYPIFHDGQVVSFQGRDVTNRAELRWKTCRKENEIRDHKHCLGGIQRVVGDSVAVVEGATDGWRMGPGAVWTFGTTYLIEQVRLLLPFKRRFVILDSEEKDPNAAKQAQKFCDTLSGFPGETIIVELDEGDPGTLPQEEADYLMEKEWRIRR